jgi:hypothetical protein
VIAQAVVVVALAVVVFATLLQPEGNSPLSGVESPGAPRQTGLPEPGGYAGANEHNGGGGRQTEPATTENEGGGVGGGVVVPPATGATPATPAAPPSAGGSEGTPADDQYADTLTRLNARLN